MGENWANLVAPTSHASTNDFLRDNEANWWNGNSSGVSGSGFVVNERTAENFSAVWAATRAIASTLASLPAQVYEINRRDNTRRLAHDSSWWSLLHNQPNPDMDSFQFFELMTKNMVNQGNGFAEIERNNRDQPIALWPIDNSRVRAWRPPQVWDPQTGTYQTSPIEWHIYADDADLTGPVGRGPYHVIDDRNMLNVVGTMSRDGILGPGVIGRATETIGLGLATERYGADFFGSGGRPSGVLEHPGTLQPEDRDNIRREWRAKHAGPNNWNEIAILWENMKYQSIGIAPDQAQFLGTRALNVEEIARWYGIAPAIIQHYKESKFQTVDAQIRHFLMLGLRDWAERWEAAVRRQLFQFGSFALEFSMKALLRGDPKAQAETSKIEVQWGKKTLNEWRREDGLNPIDGETGDVHFMPANMATIDQVVSGEFTAAGTDDDDNGAPPRKRRKGNGGDENEEGVRQLTYANRVFETAVARILEVERAQTLRAAKGGKSFSQWLTKFCGSFETKIVDAIQLGVEGILDAKGLQVPAHVFAVDAARRHLVEFKQDVARIEECPPEETIDRLMSVLDNQRITLNLGNNHAYELAQ